MTRPWRTPSQDPTGVRRPPAIAIAALLGFVILGLPVTFLDGCGAREQPNVLLVVIDTARADRFSFDGYRRETSPRIAALGAEGAIYLDARTPAPWTLPAHASLFTGLFPSAHGAESGHLKLDDEHLTLAEAFRAAGYRTVGYTANPWVGREHHFDQGFETYEEVWRNLDQAEGDTGAGLLDRKVDRWLQWREGEPDARRRPFFLFLNYLEPHLPYDPPEPERSAFLRRPVEPETVERLRRFRHPQDVRYNLGLTPLTPRDLGILSDLYDGEIAYVDRRVGELADLLRRRGLLDGTIVAITSDHGESIGEHRLIDHKMSVYENLLRIPLILRYPPAIPARQTIRDPVMLQDLYPTLLRLAGIVPPVRNPPGASPGPAAPALPAGTPVEATPLPGVSFPGTAASPRGPRKASGRTGEPSIAEFARPLQFLEVIREVIKGADVTPFNRTLIAYRVGDEKLHWASDGKHRLYDLAQDPGEETDLAAARPDRVAALAARVEAWLRRPGSRPPLGRAAR
jgi:arylsulfatase A-like enzyme